MKIPNGRGLVRLHVVSLARIVSEDSQLRGVKLRRGFKSSKDS